MRRSLSRTGVSLALICVLAGSAAIGNPAHSGPPSLGARLSTLFSRLPARALPFAGTSAFFEGLSAKDRMANFEKIWHSIQDNYYDPGLNGVNWDEVHQRYRP